MTSNRPTASSDHAAHDPLLIARLAGADLAGVEETAARGLVASCEECATMLADLVAISAALPSAVPAGVRRRDFRLTEEDAFRLRGSRVSRWLERARRQRILLLQPLAAATVALGLAMAVMTGPGMLPMAAPEVAPVAGEVQSPEAAFDQMTAPNVAAPAGDGSEGADKGGTREPLVPEQGAESPGLTVSGGADEGATGEPGVAGAETPPALTAPGPGDEAVTAGAVEGASAATVDEASPGDGASPEAWQIWLLVAAAGVGVLVAVAVRTRQGRTAG